VSGVLGRHAGLPMIELTEHLYVHYAGSAVQHLFAVAAGLDSMVIGEAQILGQLRAAYAAADTAGTVGRTLHELSQQALRVGKRVHTETEIGSAGRSLVTAAYELLEADLGPIAGRRLLVLGAGSMAGLAARTAAAAGARVTCVNRTYERAQRLAATIGAQARPLAELTAALGEADLVVACTGARDVFLDAEQLRHTPVVGIVDLALPADVSTDVVERDVVLVNLARLVANQPDHASRGQVEAARRLVAGEVNDFLGLRRAAQVAPTVVALRTMASEVVSSELARLDGRAPELTHRERDEVHRTVRRVVDKLLHQPTVRVQELASDPESLDYAAALRELFALDPQTVAAVMLPAGGRS